MKRRHDVLEACVRGTDFLEQNRTATLVPGLVNPIENELALPWWDELQGIVGDDEVASLEFGSTDIRVLDLPVGFSRASAAPDPIA